MSDEYLKEELQMFKESKLLWRRLEHENLTEEFREMMIGHADKKIKELKRKTHMNAIASSTNKA